MTTTAQLSRMTFPIRLPADGVVRRSRSDARLIRRASLAAAGDTLLMVAALGAVLVLTNLDRMPQGASGFLSLRITVKNVAVLGMLLMVWPIVFRMCRVYQRRPPAAWAGDIVRVALASTIASWMTVVFSLTSSSGYFQTRSVAVFWVVSTVLLAASRCALPILMRCRTPKVRRVVIVGAGPRGRTLCRNLRNSRRVTYEVLGFVDGPVESNVEGDAREESPVLSAFDGLESVLMHEAVDEVFVTLPVGSHYQQIRQTIEVCERVGVQAKYRADIVDSQLAWTTYDDGDGTPIVTMHMTADDWRLLVKRGVDIVVGTLALLALAPLMALIALTIRLTSKGPSLFSQERYGLNRRVFRMYKFRTMVENADTLQELMEQRNEMDGPVFKIRNDPRITAIGRWLRRTSLDELPQLLSVVGGQMSLVGPRPLPLRDVSRFTEASLMRRFSVKPGLTCLWQISGRSNVSFERWIALDLQYIDGWSLALDFVILLKTFPVVLRGDGAV